MSIESAEAKSNQAYVVLGEITTVFGVKGWVKVRSFTEVEDSIFEYAPWTIRINNQIEQLVIEDARYQNKGMTVKIEGCDDRELAKRYAGAQIVAPRDQLPEIEDEEQFYWSDLEGLEVCNLDGYKMGTVSHVLETGANDVLVVKALSRDAFGMKERLIPYVWEQVIKKVDLESKVITVDWDAYF